MKVKIKRLLPEAIIPKYAHSTDAGLDLCCTSINREGELYIEYGTGLAIEIPEGYVGLLFPRSSISNKDMILANSVGVIDSGYRGEIKLRFKIIKDKSYRRLYEKYEKVGQLVIIPYPSIEFEEIEELSISERMEGGFGSTNKL